jgi:hypothetical protein
MSVMNRMKVPELLQEIAAFVDNSRDLSAFAQVDRFAHAVVTPCIFRNIELRLDFVDSLAVAFPSVKLQVCLWHLTSLKPVFECLCLWARS